MNAHALRVLEFDAVLKAVADRAASDRGRAELLALVPRTDIAWIREELACVAETLELHRARPAWSPPPPPPADEALRTLAREGAVLDPARLLLILRLLEASGRLVRETADVDADSFPRLQTLASRATDDPARREQLAGIVDDDGVVRDGASPLLRQLRRRIRAARNRIVKRIEGWAASLPERYRVPDASVALRDGRYVIQLRREGRSDVGGVIHGESATGQTLFVEPPLALELMNEILEMERDEAREIEAILRDATEQLRPSHGDIAASLDALVALDTLWARAFTAARWGAHLPVIVPGRDDEGIRVEGARHPLLLERSPANAASAAPSSVSEASSAPDRVIPFSVALEPDERALVISGPNTGGKTVFLKAMGLIPLLAQSGILPPVGPETRLPLFHDILADIGDEQSIAESLSTFSAHLARAGEILEHARPGTLVLMDEMGTGTDPGEGAALARAMLEALVERGARAIVTSHLGAMKRLDTEGSGIVNGSLLFDAERIEPTYLFRKGRPGRSYGLAIARRLGFPGAILDRAEGFVDSGELEVETLLASLQQKEEALTRALDDATAARDGAERLLEESRRDAAALDERERSAEERARDEARRLLLEAREEVEQVIRELRDADAEARDERAREARRRIEQAARGHEERAASRRGVARKGRRGKASETRDGVRVVLEAGHRVRILGSGAKGIVREIDGDRITVEAGALRFDLDIGEVERIRGPEPRTGGRRAPAATMRDVSARPEVHLLGLRVEEVEPVLARALDDAILAELPQLRIVHGVGTGAVRSRVHELLRRDARVREFRGGLHGEGGAGVTVAVLP